MKMNEARKLNNRAVVDEQERLTDPTFEKRRNKEELYREKRSVQDALTAQGLSKEKASYAFDQAAVAEKHSKKKKGRGGAGAFGWDVFNEDSLYSAYFKRVKQFEGKPDSIISGVQAPEAGDRVQKMADDLEQQIEKRGQFRRERMIIDSDQDLDSINDRNRVFNQKLERSFSKYAQHIKANIESGNAV